MSNKKYFTPPIDQRYKTEIMGHIPKLNEEQRIDRILHIIKDDKLSVYDVLARHLGLVEVNRSPNVWVNKQGRQYYLTEFGFKPLEERTLRTRRI